MLNNQNLMAKRKKDFITDLVETNNVFDPKARELLGKSLELSPVRVAKKDQNVLSKAVYR